MSRSLTKANVEAKIARGDCLVIFKNDVLKLNSWLHRHPGGDKAILHMVGRDATDEINGYHCKETIGRMKGFSIGQLSATTKWTNRVPPIQGGFFDPSADFEDEGIVMDGSDSELDSSPRIRNTSSTKSARVTIEDIADVDQLSNHERKEIQRDLDNYPSLDPSTQGNIQSKYRALAHRLESEGYYECHYLRDYGTELLRWMFLAFVSLYLYSYEYYKLSAVFLGIFWHQVTFAVHDAGHMGITHSYNVDGFLASTVASFVGGLSVAWWKRNHNIHHIVTNQPEHDPDIQHMPIFAITPRLLSSLTSTYYEKVLPYDMAAQALITVQKYIFYPVMMFGRFNLYRLSIDHIVFNRGPKTRQAQLLRLYEAIGMVCFHYWYSYMLVGSIPTVSQRVWFVLISHWVTAPLHVQITLSHFAMSTASLGPNECFAQQQLRTTMDVDCPAYLDWIHGGLQFQAIHHLFPRVPRHRLREVQPSVRQFAKDVGIEYKVYGFKEGNGIVLSRLQEVSKQAKILAKCAQHMCSEGEYGLDLSS